MKFRNEVLKQPGGKDILVQGRPKNKGVNWINDQIRDLIKVCPAVVTRHCSLWTSKESCTGSASNPALDGSPS